MMMPFVYVAEHEFYIKFKSPQKMPWFDERRYESRCLFCRVHHFQYHHLQDHIWMWILLSLVYLVYNPGLFCDVLGDFLLKNLTALKNVYVICVILHENSGIKAI